MTPSPRRAGPIVIVGTGRCGSTLLHRQLAVHPELGWISAYNDKLPWLPPVAMLHNAYRLPISHTLRDKRYFPKPYEAYDYWEHDLPGFKRRDRPITDADVPADRVGPTADRLRAILRYQGRRRLLIKVTGWSRMAFFERLLDDPVFICLRRDPRSVIASWIKAGWLDVTSPPRTPGWQWGDVPDDLYDLYEELGGGPVLAAAIKVRLDLEDIERHRAQMPHALEVWFEELVTQPQPTMQRICEFAGLSYDGLFVRRTARRPIYDPTGKWRRDLAPDAAERLLEFLRRSDELSPSGLVASQTFTDGRVTEIEPAHA